MNPPKETPAILPGDEPSIFDQLTTLDRTALVRPNNPPKGIAGFLFNFDAEQFLELISEITDNPVEDNTTLQDNIALLPERVTLRGMVAELTDAADIVDTPAPTPAPLPLFPPLFPSFSLGANLSFGSKLGAFGLNAGVSIGPGGIVSASAAVAGSIGPFSADALVRTVSGELSGVLAGFSANVQAAVSSSVNNAIKSLSGGNAPSSGAIAAAVQSAVGNIIGPSLTPSVAGLITQSVNASLSTTAGTTAGPTAGAADSLYAYYVNRAPIQLGQTMQSFAVSYFCQMWLARQMFSVETPWGIMNNMGILNMRAEQPEETKYGTNFSVTFKKIRVARSVTVNLGQLAGRNAFQASTSAPAQKGQVSTTPAAPAQEESWLSTLAGSPGP